MVKTMEDRIINAIIYTLLIGIAICSVFPLLYVVSVSLTPLEQVLKHGGFMVVPRAITFSAYEAILDKPEMVRALIVTVVVTIVGTIVNLVLTTLLAYPLSDKQIPGRQLFLFLIVFTLLFSGGIIPTYLVVKQAGLLNSFWAMIIPSAISSFNVLLMKTFFENIPKEIIESARIDGAREWRLLLGVVLPLSVPSLLTIGLFYMVAHWNGFFAAFFYITNRNWHPLQIVLRDMLSMANNTLENFENAVPSTTLQMAAVIFATLPIIIVYPFMQKHFVKGMLLGSVKG